MSTEQRDPYEVLGVARDATAAEIARAYRRLVRRHHPDTSATSAGDVDRRRERPADADRALGDVIAAYAVLRDPERRAEYDRRTQPRPRPVEGPRRRAASSRPGPAGAEQPLLLHVTPVRQEGVPGAVSSPPSPSPSPSPSRAVDPFDAMFWRLWDLLR